MNRTTSWRAVEERGLFGQLLGEYVVRRVEGDGVNSVRFTAFATTADGYRAYATMADEDERENFAPGAFDPTMKLGRIGQENYPADIEGHGEPATVERLERMGRFTAENEERAYRLIEAAYPEAKDGARAVGSIILTPGYVRLGESTQYGRAS